MSDKTPSMSRRSFLKATGALGALAAAGGALTASESLVNETEPAYADAEETIAWGRCNVNCGGNCTFKFHVKDGKAIYMETDDTGDADFQSRACLRGRSMRKWLNHPDRLTVPMKRVGNRGDGEFEEITWDEAIEILHDQLEHVYSEYGPNAIYPIYATGMYSATGKNYQRLLGLLGGYLNQGYDYSTHMMSAAMPYMFGSDAEAGSVYSPYDAYNASSMSEAEANSDLLVMFGNSPAETRMGGSNTVWDYALAREAILERGGKVIHIDYRMNETISGEADNWIPIRPGTDSALCAALIHEFIEDGATDEDFLSEYCVGWDETTMPDSAKGQNKSFKAYIMGTGYDKVEKTPEWAAEITAIPAAKIRELAEDLEDAEAPFVVQGWGPQRHTNGEDVCRMISMVPIALGQIGLPGTNTGQREAEPPVYLVGSIPSENPNPTTIPVYQWLNAVDHGSKMTATNAGIMGADELGTDIKFIWCYAGNCITNQHGDINYVHEVLSDESKCEFILVYDTVMTDSARYADLLLPDAMRTEQINMYSQGYSEYYTGIGVGTACQDPPGECRPSYEVMADLAETFGLRDEFTEGKTQEEWVQYIYETGTAEDGDTPSWEEMLEQGVYKRKLPACVGLDAFREDPEENPLGTPSGKIEIYSETLANIAETWEFDEDDDEIDPIPMFQAGFQGYGSVTDEYPLYCTGFHHKSRTHSSFGFIEDLEKVANQVMWINPIDADERKISNGDACSVASPAGEIRIEARVTNRIVPGVIAIPQGAWHDADMSGDQVDHGGCVNTLTTYHPTPLAKGNGPADSIIAQAAKA